MMYLKKAQDLISAMKANGFAVFDGDEKDAYATLEDIFSSFMNYADSVLHMTALSPLWRAQLDGAVLRDKMQTIDEKRRMQHETVMANVRLLNTLCEKHGLPPFVDINPTDRHLVGEFVGSWITEIYMNRAGYHKI